MTTPDVRPYSEQHPCMTCGGPSGVTYGELATMPPVAEITCGECVDREREERDRARGAQS